MSAESNSTDQETFENFFDSISDKSSGNPEASQKEAVDPSSPAVDMPSIDPDEESKAMRENQEEQVADFEKHEFVDATTAEHSNDSLVLPPKSAAQKRAQTTQEQAFDQLEERCRGIINTLPFSNKAKYDEMRLHVTRSQVGFVEDPSPQELSKQLGKIQIFKDNIIEIFADAHTDYIARKRIFELLVDAFAVISEQKSSDKRKGEATLRLAEFGLAVNEAEAFYTFCKQIVDNLESQHKTVSRRITCKELQIHLGELETGVQELDIPDKKKVVGDLKESVKSDEKTPGTVDWGEV